MRSLFCWTLVVFGLADAALLPYVLRMDHLAMTPLIEARPRVAKWYARVRELPAYQVAVTDWLPELVVELFRERGREAWPEVEALAKD